MKAHHLERDMETIQPMVKKTIKISRIKENNQKTKQILKKGSEIQYIQPKQPI